MSQKQFRLKSHTKARLSGLIFTFITDTDPVDHVPETGSYENYTHQRHQRYNGAYQDLYRKSRIRAARKKRRTMDDVLRIPYSSSERTMKGRGKRHSKKNFTNVIPDHRLIGMCVSVRMVRPSPRSPERQSPVPAAGRFPGLRIITKGRLPGCKVQ